MFFPGDQVCFHVVAVDIADNASPEVVKCVEIAVARVEPAVAPPAPRPTAARFVAVESSARFPIIVWSIIGAMLVFASYVRGYRISRRWRADANPVHSDPVLRIARVLRAGGLAMILLAALLLGVVLVSTSNPEQMAWYGGGPAVSIPLALLHVLRGQRIASLLTLGAVASTDGKGHVFIVRSQQVKSWLYITSGILERADLHAVPPARVHRE